MRLARKVLWVVSAWVLLHAGAAAACTLVGKVICEGNGVPVSGVTLTITGPSGFTVSAVTDAEGAYSLYMPYKADGVFSATLDLTAVGGGVVVSPPQPFVLYFPAGADQLVQDWVVDVAGCAQKGCWLTGGGAKFSVIAGIPVAEQGPKISFGGNVNPGCSPTAGDGGNWNNVDHDQKLHFQGRHIEVVECGTLFPPTGSTSPKTPYTYIIYQGTGVMRPIAGGKYAGPENVCFLARAEDRNEPGSTGQRDGAYKDRYFLRVFVCPNAPVNPGMTLYQIGTMADPVIITDGNLQLHISSCP